MKNKNIQDELNELSPLLSQIKKEQKKEEAMPANYFSRFEDRLMHRIVQEEALEPQTVIAPTEKKNWLTALLALFTPQYAPRFAFGLIVMFGSFYLMNYFYSENGIEAEVNASTLLAELSLEETESYLMDNTEDIAIVEIAELLKEEEWTEIQEDAEAALEVKEESITVEVPSTKGKKEVSTIEKALEATDNDNLLDDITEEDLEGYELF